MTTLNNKINTEGYSEAGKVNTVARLLFMASVILTTQWHTMRYNPAIGDRNITVKESSRTHDVKQQRTPFNPFRDLTIDLFSSSPDQQQGKFAEPVYSAHRCVELAKSYFAPFVSRTCLFHNLFFNPYDETFHYYASPAESSAYSKKELEEIITTANGYIHSDAIEAALMKGDDFSENSKVQFAPVVHHNETFPPANFSIARIQSPSDPVFVLYRPSYSFNFGHFLWDDAMGVFTMLDFFGLTQLDVNSNNQQYPQKKFSQHIPVHLDQGDDPFYRCSHKYRWDKCIKMMRKVMPQLMGIETDQEGKDGGDILRVGNLFKSFYNTSAKEEKGQSSELVLLPKVITGPGRNSHFSCRGECTIHRTGRYYRFRQWLFQNIFGRNRGNILHEMPASPNKITISLPIGNSHSPEEIQSFEAILPALIEKYGSDNVQAVDMSKLTLEEQANLTASSKVYLTNNGGGSATSFFLQRGSSVLLFHGELQRDIELYSTVGYLNVDWVPVTASVEAVLKFVDRAIAQPSDER